MFFSNVYDEKSNNFSKKVIDLSVNGKQKFPSPTIDRWDIDFTKQIDFLNSRYYSQVEIEAPIAAHLVVNVFNAAFDLRRLRIPSDNLHELHKLVRRRTGALTDKSRFTSLIRYLYFIGFLFIHQVHIRFKDENESAMYDLDFDVGEIIKNIESTDQILDALILNLKARCEKAGYFNSKDNHIFSHPKLSDGQLVTRQFAFLSNLNEATSKISIDYETDTIRKMGRQSFTIQHTTESRDFLRNLSANMSFIRYMNLDWVGLSSGQKAYLNLFSILTAALKKINSTNVLLCIDEGDLYLHPKWQAEFLQRLLTALSIVTKAEIQLVLTSHSPLLVSDLPRQNLAILGDMDSSDAFLETFGANLYDLYAGPLFLGELTSGLFSHSKIYEFMRLAKNEKLTNTQKKYIKSFIEILGDKVLKFSVEKMLKSTKAKIHD